MKATAGRQTASRAKGRTTSTAKGRKGGRHPLRSGGIPAQGQQIDLGGLDQLTGYVVRRAQVWIFQDFKRVLKNLEMTPAQFSVMRIVAANAGIVQARVAEVLCIERARLVEMLDRLEARQLIKRSRSATDRRSHALEVTRTGMALLDSLQPRVAEHEQNVLSRIGAKDKAELLRILAPLLR